MASGGAHGDFRRFDGAASARAMAAASRAFDSTRSMLARQGSALGHLEDALQKERGDRLGGDALRRGLGQGGLDMGQ